MALMKENINWLQQNGHTSVTKQRENVSFYMQMDFQNSVQRASKIHWCTAEAEMSAGTGLSLVHLLIFPSGKHSYTNLTAARLHAATGSHVRSSCTKICTQTSQVSSVKSKAQFLSSYRLYTSQAPTLPPAAYFCIEISSFIYSICVGNLCCTDRPWQWDRSSSGS